MIKKLVVLVAICLSVSLTGFAKELPDYLKWRSIEEYQEYDGQHAYCGRVQKFYYVYDDVNDGKSSLMEYYFVNGGEKVRLLANQRGHWIFLTYFYAKDGSVNTPKCFHPSKQKHDFYVRDNPSDEWRVVSWSEAQRFLNARDVYRVRVEHFLILPK